MDLTTNEREQLEALRQRLLHIAAHLQKATDLSASSGLLEWYTVLSGLKELQGNASNDLSRVTSLMARSYLMSKLSMRPFDSLLKAQGASGFDIDEQTLAGERVVGEIKATEPYKPNDLGAAQREEWEKDFEKLNRAETALKYFFVTQPRAFALLKKKYARMIPGVKVVLLTTGEELIHSPSSLPPAHS